MNTMDTGISSAMNRLVDNGFNIDKGQRRHSLRGMLEKDKPQIPLSEALILLESKGILHGVTQSLENALSHVRKMNEKGLFPQLNDDQKASITIYMMESQPPEDSVSYSEFHYFYFAHFLLAII